MKHNFGFKIEDPAEEDWPKDAEGERKKPLRWKEPNFEGDEVKMDNFRNKDGERWDGEVEVEK